MQHKDCFFNMENSWDTLLDCCTANFNWNLYSCCPVGGGCNDTASSTNPTMPLAMTEPISLKYPIIQLGLWDLIVKVNLRALLTSGIQAIHH